VSDICPRQRTRINSRRFRPVRDSGGWRSGRRAAMTETDNNFGAAGAQEAA